MNFDLSEEQQLLKDSARRYGADHGDFTAWRARVERGEAYDAASWRRMADLGWLMLNVPEDDGGLGAGPTETMVVAEAVGRYLMLVPFVSTGVIAPTLLTAATEALRAHLMAGLAEGKLVISLADAEPNGRFDLNRIATRAEAVEGGFRLTGAKSHALDGGAADWFIVPARTTAADDSQDGVSLFLVPAEIEGLTVMRSRAMDNRHNASLKLDGVVVPAANLIGGLGEGFPLLRDAVDRGVVARLAEAVGAMDAVREMTMEYLKTRKQFGQTLGAFQALQHRAVDMAIACEEARSMMYLATLALSGAPVERRKVIAAAKARVGQTSLYVGRQAVQLHGGVGFTEELAVAHYLKRLIMIDMAFGNADHHRAELAASLRPGAVAA
ncbi:acyl-CoA dehydrogenase family protein [Caulobacter vibrioides]|uniref:Acyl-CoA dehydrogenase family protein n=2 Tax=Caulobacter vibrioides TaxID=155892 RepID=Q9A7B7_CAUVC|nr:acyl-CoA dehydrogenase [Caulobacter vibrioides]YP_002517257.1 acyl-CoA dehydrogenase, short-chain specific [Caulobacter vibrioides NA1000]AAK23783.1 acyl-CoA dehydrogenase family protein [Caulobacter vibrioides CB15]ACL95349.1 acyl-CoA dehydrogenase, short-chain specific [Caulobacter vibrioides NA1000]ATC28683.1 acyl-CoA dehydrogenase [Caulobacter vibrioides]QXZ53863.1 acyl-CoA dehydrogenase [Caulobacter vibrioides]